ncbi:MAG TPA: hypothetical protein VKB51_10055 [bacterium]|nr:hypothetical protein [bacterium]
MPAPLLPFQLEGGAQLMLRGERESGDLTLQADAGPVYRLELHAPLTGSVVVELRLAPRRLLLIDYADKTYLSAPNTPETRLRLFQVDLTPAELETFLTGRVSRARFAAGGGTLEADAGGSGVAEFREAGAVQRFRLDAHGLPTEWTKTRDGALVFRVEFREYLELPRPGGPPLRLPRKMRLYTDGGPARLVVGVRTFEPGQRDGTGWEADALPAAAAGFAPGRLPEPPPATAR